MIGQGEFDFENNKKWYANVGSGEWHKYKMLTYKRLLDQGISNKAVLWTEVKSKERLKKDNKNSKCAMNSIVYF